MPIPASSQYAFWGGYAIEAAKNRSYLVLILNYDQDNINIRTVHPFLLHYN